ncbi:MULTISPECIES: RNA polymerase sigma factor [unclassified Leeuwenhoekiella]|uniref:RNA polymerase sigma factor n=1 Tax=unclassified Leeuwenhoekiella TaxID=2615029 RepID=UPI0025C249E2|nr:MULTISPECIES: RNA polymerase sigma factor [unclassified Leeuwenhoekiella]
MQITEILERCKQNDRRAQMQLYKKYSDGMYYVAFRFLKNSFEAEEAMQEGFVKAFTKMHQYNGEVTFGAWLKRIVINKSIDMLKAKKLELVAMNEQVLGTVDEQNDWSVDDGITLDQIKQAIEELPERYRYAVMLFLIEGYDHQEISEILEITEVASRTLVHRGKKKLQEKLKTKYNGTGY